MSYTLHQIIEDILLLDQSIVLKFPDKESLRTFKSMLSTYVSRKNTMLLAIGGTDILGGKMVWYEWTSEINKYPASIEVSLQPRKEKKLPLFEILEVREAKCDPNSSSNS